MKLKYCIEAYLKSLPRQKHTLKMKELLDAIAPTPRSTFYRWRKIEEGTRAEIPHSKQVAIAAVMGCTTEELQGDMFPKRKRKK